MTGTGRHWRRTLGFGGLESGTFLAPRFGDEGTGKCRTMVIALTVVLVIPFVWVLMTLLLVWQQDAPISTGLGNALSDQYRESVTRNLASQRKQAAFMRRTVWPVSVVCGSVAVGLIVVMNV